MANSHFQIHKFNLKLIMFNNVNSFIECGEKELHNVGGRLLQWFSEMKRQAREDIELPLHSLFIIFI